MNPPTVSTATYAEAAGISTREVRKRIANGSLAGKRSPSGGYRVAWAAYEEALTGSSDAPSTPTGRDRPRVQRAAMGAVRGMWTFILPGLGFALTWAIDNLVDLGVFSLPVSLALGAFFYALKRYLFPDTTF